MIVQLSRSPLLEANNDVPLVLDRVLYVQRMLARQRKSHGAAAKLFGDPALTVLLDLYVHGERGQSVSTKCALLASQIPTSTAMRLITRMEEQGLIARIADVKDKRRVFVLLTRDGKSLVEAFARAT